MSNPLPSIAHLQTAVHEALLAAHETGRLAGHQECRVAVAVLRDRCEQQAVTLEMYRKNAAGSALRAQRQHEEIERLRAANAGLKISVIAFGAPAAAAYARDHGLPHNHLHPEHYDILARAGARMDDFTRAELAKAKRCAAE